MKRLFILMISLLLITAAFANGRSSRRRSRDHQTAKISSATILEQVVARLKRVEQTVYPSLDRRTAADTQAIMMEVYSLLQLLPQDIDVSVRKDDPDGIIDMTDPQRHGYAPPSRLIERPRPVPTRYPMMTADFEDLLSAVKDETFGSSKITLLRTASESNLFSVDQIIRVLDAVTFSSDKLEALSILYPGCTDPNNKYRILDSFTMMDDKTSAAEIMSNN